jgi:hypothetical protein
MKKCLGYSSASQVTNSTRLGQGYDFPRSYLLFNGPSKKPSISGSQHDTNAKEHAVVGPSERFSLGAVNRELSNANVPASRNNKICCSVKVNVSKEQTVLVLSPYTEVTNTPVFQKQTRSQTRLDPPHGPQYP